MHFFFSSRFLPLFVTQFLGAFNDNFLKNALVVLITYRLAEKTGQNPQILVAMAAGLFILPYFLFSALSGQVADTFPRHKIARAVKGIELVLAFFAWLGFSTGNVWFLMLVLFLMGTHSTFFSPVKYALLPQHLHKDELLSGNAYIGAGTFLAILLGTICGGLLILKPQGDFLSGMALLWVAICGYLASVWIPEAKQPSKRRLKIRFNPWSETKTLLAYSKSVPLIYRAILAISWFWFIGATFLAQFPAFARDVLHADETVVTFFLTIFSIGVGIGSFVCNRMLKGKVKLTYTLYAAIGMGVCALDLALVSFVIEKPGVEHFIGLSTFLQSHMAWRITGDLFLLAVCGGIYVVPLYAYLQQYGDPEYLARLVAANNIVNAIYMVASSLFIIAMVALGAMIPHIFLLVGALNFVVCWWLYHNRITRQTDEQV